MSSYPYLFEILLQLFLHFVDGDVEKLHLSGEFRKSFFHKLLFAGFLNLLLGSSGNKVAQASLVVDDLVGGKQVVCLHGCVGIYLSSTAYSLTLGIRSSSLYLPARISSLNRSAICTYIALSLLKFIIFKF